MVRRTMFKRRIGSTRCRTDLPVRLLPKEKEKTWTIGWTKTRKKRQGRLEAKPMERTILVIVAIMDGQTGGHEIETVAGKT